MVRVLEVPIWLAHLVEVITIKGRSIGMQAKIALLQHLMRHYRLALASVQDVSEGCNSKRVESRYALVKITSRSSISLTSDTSVI